MLTNPERCGSENPGHGIWWYTCEAANDLDKETEFVVEG